MVVRLPQFVMHYSKLCVQSKKNNQYKFPNSIKSSIQEFVITQFQNRKELGRQFENCFDDSILQQLDRQFEKLEQFYQPLGLILGSSYLLATACELSGYDVTVAWLPALIGGVVGSWFAVLNRFGLVRLWIPPKQSLNVVITGGTKGIGKAMAREFLLFGDSVIITSRSSQSVQQTVQSLREELGIDSQISGISCDVTDPAQVSRLAKLSESSMGIIDVWINNAGYSGGFQTIMDMNDDCVQAVVQTNLVGTVLCTKAAIEVMKQQSKRGHVFLMDGAGADGLATPMYSVYGSTKAAVSSMSKSLQKELEKDKVGIHTLSPGMVLTDLLLEGATIANKQVFNVLCEQPETVAAYLVSRVRSVVARNVSGSYIKFLTPINVIWRILTAPSRVGRFFDVDGEPKFQEESERLQGRKAKVTARLSQRFRARDSSLGVVYSLSIALSYMLIIGYGMPDKIG
eukprot:TRINITY_DN6007_c0_g1_i2.p1 TRINITY_DN6007_c0_g1~~TRINITY_DN6007_c0_g1_i2.p1  ORF type:complete len:465 (-),score=45.21 TRINITY_DN6007_c0_g1_i2:439-1809(-)